MYLSVDLCCILMFNGSLKSNSFLKLIGFLADARRYTDKSQKIEFDMFLGERRMYVGMKIKEQMNTNDISNSGKSKQYSSVCMCVLVCVCFFAQF